MKKIKVVFYIAGLYQGGGERVISELSLRLPDNIESTLLLFEKKISYPFKGEILDLGIPLSINFFLRGYRFFPRLFSFRKIIRQLNPDYVISLGNSANMMNLLTNNEKAIVRVDMHPTEGNRGFWGILYRIFMKLFFRRAKSIMSVSKDAANDLVKHYGVPAKKIRVLYNPIDIQKIDKLSRKELPIEYAHLFEQPVIVNMGRLTKQKGQRYLIDAFALLKKEFPDGKLLILGDGELRGDLESLAHESAVAQDIHIIPWQENPFAFLSRASMFVLPSLWEGLPTVLLEALACGVPIISTDCKSGPREILIQGSGILVPVANEHALYEAMKTIYHDSSIADVMKRQAKTRAKDFDIESILKEWESILS